MGRNRTVLNCVQSIRCSEQHPNPGCVNAKSSKGTNALALASKKGHTEVVKLLKAHGAK
jgi:hypothetical protein